MKFEKPQKYTTRVSDKYYVSDNERFLYVKFELVLPDRISFEAGQYVSLKINEQGERRSYSIVNTPDDSHGFHLLAEIIENGKGSEFLQNVKIGEVIEVLGPLGKFTTSNLILTNKLLFVATGSGIVPIWSMINDLLINRHEARSIRLHWGMKSEKDLFFVDNLERLAEEYPNFVYDIVLSKPGKDWDLCSGHVQDCLQRDFATSILSDWEGYVCGNPSMVEEVCTLLPSLGMKLTSIHREKFT